MQVRGLLIGLAVLALLGGGVYWSEKSKEAEKNAPPKDASPKITTITEQEIAQLEFRKKGMPPTILKHGGDGKWTITEPKTLGVDADAISNVLQTLVNFSSETVTTPPAGTDLNSFGLKDPLFTLNIVKKNGKHVAVLLGDPVPVAGSIFVKLDNDPRVFTAPSITRTSLDKQWRDLRDKRLLTVENDKLSRVELDANGKVIEFGKNAANEWQIVKPNAYRADTFGVEDLVRKLKDVKLDPAVPDADAEKAEKAFASATPVGVAKLTDASGTQQLDIRKTKDKEPVYYAKSSAVEGVHKVLPDLATSISKPIADYRNKKVFDFGFNDPSKIDMKINGKAKSCGKLAEKWVCDAKEVKPETVSAFVDKIRDLSAKQFAEKPAKPASPAEIEITVYTNDAKKSETVRIYGNNGARGDEPPMYELDPANVDGIKQAFDAIKEPAPAADNKKK
jgi:hypothetical protein